MQFQRYSAVLAATLVAASLAACGSPVITPAGGTRAGVQAQGENREFISRISGDSPNFAQLANGNMMTVVSRDFGRGAKPGALLELFYPYYAKDHLWDSYVGIRDGERLQWAHELTLERQALVPDSGVAISVFRHPRYRLTIEDVVHPGSNAHVRRVTVTNTSGSTLSDLQAAFYGFFTLNHLPTGDRLEYRPEARAFVQTDNDVAVAVTTDREPDAWHCGDANLPLGNHRDARKAAEADKLSDSESAGPWLSGVNAAMTQTLPVLGPGASASVLYTIGIAEDGERALSAAQGAVRQGWEGIRTQEAAYWRQWLAQGQSPALAGTAAAVYRRALITLKQHAARNGAIIAAPSNLSPAYRLVWPRDGSLIALTLLEAGFPREARAFFPFIERMQKADGGWAINFFPDGSRPLWDFGTNGNEHDQVGIYAWAVGEAMGLNNDGAWLAERWPHVRSACEFLLRARQNNGLLSRSRDLWELDQDGTWTFSNAAACAGLQAGARIAERQGAKADAERYRSAAAQIRQAMSEQLVVEGRFARGLRGSRLDATVEIANLALGGPWFKLWDDRDPIMQATGEAIAARLVTPAGGIRRYEGDRYYGGQPWPVATGWLALHRQARGDAGGARQLFDVMTGYAAQTEALMLGEQFDEGSRRWVSAFPLAWSEATYIRTALQLAR